MERALKKNKLFSFILSLILVVACNDDNPQTRQQSDEQRTNEIKSPNTVPSFNVDSAYQFITKQVSFGPRVPGSKEHFKTFEYLRNQLGGFADSLFVQTGSATTFDKKQIPIYNIIASFNPNHSKRILLAAHWDTRPFADEDDSAAQEPILGANDGGSGVGVLLEIARILHQTPVDYGIDIIFFDAEDWGNGAFENSYCLGSQFWGKRTHVPNYQADFGILLDMVGAKNAQFAIEGFSQQTAPFVVKKVWGIASEIGYSGVFVNYNRGYVTDDHFYVNQATGIPMIDIIHYEPNVGQSFGTYWHTHDDNMDIISKATLQAVGQTITTLLYRE